MCEVKRIKKFNLVSELELENKVDTQYSNIPVQNWTTKQFLAWMIHIARKSQIDFENFEMCSFQCTGKELLLMTKQDFISRDTVYGSILFDELEILRNYSSESSSGVNSSTEKTPKEKKTRNKTKTQESKKCRLIWMYIRDLLHNPEYCPHWICWENPEEGTFRFIEKEKIAKKWGSTSNSKKEMTYEKFSRAIRQNYASEMLASAPARLVYKFGPKAIGWRHHNPNFT